MDFQNVLSEFSFLSDLHLVGGCVRDRIIGKESDDIDLATSDHPKTVIQKAENENLKVIGTGIDFGTVTVFKDGKSFEITTFRKDSDADGRHADVKFTDDIEIDLERRDFTINALALDRRLNFVDPFDGRSDIRLELIKAVGNPTERFKEDYLRIIRGCRFASRYDFNIEAHTFMAMKDLSKEVYDSVSIERFYMDLKKGFKDKKPSRFVRLMEVFGLNQSDNIPLKTLDEVSPRLRPIVYFLGVRDINEKSEELKLPNIVSKKTSRIQDLLKFVREKDLNEYNRRLFQFEAQGLLSETKEIARSLDGISGRRVQFFFEPTDFPINPVVNGTDLLEHGYKEGPIIGELIDEAHKIQLKEGITSSSRLLNRVV